MSTPTRLARSSLSDGSKSRLRGLSTLLADRTSAIPQTPPPQTPPPRQQRSFSPPHVPSPPPAPSSAEESQPAAPRPVDRLPRKAAQPHQGAAQHLAASLLLPARAPPAVSGHVNAQLRPTSAPAARRKVERRLAEQHDAKEGGDTRAALLEAGAHLWLAEELRAAADLLSEGAADPRVACETPGGPVGGAAGRGRPAALGGRRRHLRWARAPRQPRRVVHAPRVAVPPCGTRNRRVCDGAAAWRRARLGDRLWSGRRARGQPDARAHAPQPGRRRDGPRAHVCPPAVEARRQGPRARTALSQQSSPERRRRWRWRRWRRWRRQRAWR